ncbi:CRISPR-associated endonuclease Cas2 [Thiomicrospira sp. R3]|uniref:CRISPR-associated endonuclease Cas2 n=1 Tax=Thiomicrospira sp. R3 TaxID=3035472 RepID=UPI00259B3AAB|nr:CRISPR-associated endonuclease Cas2 [Thiomicrospira sp. R3]WFE69482.1 CRISPR-associated endonuclease Cas2 [Thiomicrospira sp. R3]
MPNKYSAIIAYDIKDNATRLKMLNTLKRWRLDGQKSVHECLLSANQAKKLFAELSSLADPTTDRVLLEWVNPSRPIYNRGTGGSLGFFQQIFYIK